MIRPNLEEIYERLETLKRAGSTPYRDDLEALPPYVAELEAERKELQERVKELEVYEEREMIGDPAGLGGPSISDSLRDRDAAQADAENVRRELKQAESRIHDLEMDIRSHKRTCPMFR